MNIEDNKLIAKFLYENLYEDDGIDSWVERNGKVLFYLTESKYHESWDWLMPVCHKLDNLEISNISDDNLEDYIRFSDMMDHYVTLYEIDDVYSTVLDFIKNYNKWKKIIGNILYTYLETRFYKENHSKYHKYFNEWVQNISDIQLMYFEREMNNLKK